MSEQQTGGAADDARLERIHDAFEYVPLGLYDEVTKLAEYALGEFIRERDSLRAELAAREEALRAILALRAPKDLVSAITIAHTALSARPSGDPQEEQEAGG